MKSQTLTRTFLLAAVLLSWGIWTGSAGAQEMGNLPQAGLGAQSLRPYWHVFIAYAIAIAAVLGWVISIARRLSALESRLGRDG